MEGTTLPRRSEMLEAFLARDRSYDGVFITGVRTTGIFCRPSCPAKKPRPENVEFFPSVGEALFAGFRPCRRCRPLEPPRSAPAWLAPLLAEIEREPRRRWSDADLEARGLHPDRIRRWFVAQHGMTFHGYQRARRLGLALGRIRDGEAVIEAALDHGYESLSGFTEAFRKAMGTSPSRARTLGPVVLGRLATPLGPMVAGATEEALCLLEFYDRRMLERQLRTLERRLACRVVPGANPVLEQTAAELDSYFAGNLRRFAVPSIAPGSEFQRAVWERIREIPYGATLSYAELARAVGRPSAVRAAARATGENRLALVVPCHRVVGFDGRLTGYGGGIWRKNRLLEWERAEERGRQAALPLDGRDSARRPESASPCEDRSVP